MVGLGPHRSRKVLRWIAALLIRSPDASFILDDLDELQERDLASGLPSRRVCWRYTRNMLASAVSLWRARVSRACRRLPVAGPVSWLDFKLGLRMLARYPGLAVVAVLAMAFGIAIGAGTFQFLKDAAFPTLPYAGGERVVQLQNVNTRTTREDPRALHDFVIWREELRSVEDLGAFYGLTRNLSLGEAAAPVQAVAISAAAFNLVRVPPLLGRPLVPADDAPGAPPVAVIGYDLWQGRFGGNPEVVGQTVRLGDDPTTVVGVMPQAFTFPVFPDLWVPFRLDPLAYERGRGPEIAVLGRLAPGASLEGAQTELTTLGARMADRWPATHERLKPEVRPFPRSALVAPTDLLRAGAFGLIALFLASLMVLVCANIALLLYARAATREGDVAVRSALGASRARIVAQLFAEALVLAGVATLVGLVGASVGLRWAVQVSGAGNDWIRDTLSPTTVIYAVVLAAVGAIVSGVLPGLKLTGRRSHVSLQRLAGQGLGLRMGRVWTGIIVAQVALTVLFLPIVIWVGLDAWAIRTADQGLPAAEYLSTQLAMDGSEAVRSTTEDTAEDDFIARFERAYRALAWRLAAEPGVRGVTFAEQLPGGSHQRRPVEMDAPVVPVGATENRDGGRPGSESRDELPAPAVWASQAQVASVDADFFEVMGAPILSGRGFHADDPDAEPRVVVVNESFVREFLGGRNAVGRRLRYPDAGGDESGRPEDSAPWYEIVGVVRDLAMTIDPDLPHNAGIYHPLVPGETFSVRMAVHVAGEPEAFIGRLRELATDVEPTLRLHQPRPLDQAARETLVVYDSWFRVIVIAGALALLLTEAGIYAIISFTVSRRTREIGVHVALGADRRRILAAVLSRTARQVGIGVLMGAGLLLPFMFAASHDQDAWLILRGAGLLVAYIVVMMAVCMLACVAPVRRALRIQPTEALKTDA